MLGKERRAWLDQRRRLAVARSQSLQVFWLLQERHERQRSFGMSNVARHHQHVALDGSMRVGRILHGGIHWEWRGGVIHHAVAHFLLHELGHPRSLQSGGQAATEEIAVRRRVVDQRPLEATQVFESPALWERLHPFVGTNHAGTVHHGLIGGGVVHLAAKKWSVRPVPPARITRQKSGTLHFAVLVADGQRVDDLIEFRDGGRRLIGVESELSEHRAVVVQRNR